jgi:predicted ATPase/class 3 adenylate cyclase
MPELPSGTVTFLFTDIAGSTALWERDRAAMREAVDRQLAILQSLIAAHQGVLYKIIGDGTQAAFASAEAALRAAVASQRALLAEDWGEIGPLTVRMALHAGEAIPDIRGDYLAAPLNRLARLLSTGYGGQILLSQTVQQLSRGALPAGSELRDLGEHRLRDLLEPERVYQLRHPDLPAEFPPLKSLEHRPNNLPLQPTPFLGREQEVEQVVALVRRPDVRLLTLTGPGGTGKTRLGLQVGAEVLEDFADGVFFVPLAPLTDPELVPSAIAEALEVREEGGRPLRERLLDVLAGKQLLVVLDNVEHVVGAAPFVGELLGAAPGLKVLATSRIPLRLRGEQEYAVPTLTLPRRKPPPTAEQLTQYEAVRLFIARAQAVKADFTVSNETAPAVAEICHRLDGLPLAIELAAARVRMLSPQAMLARLEQRLPLLTGGARDAPARQQTLRNTIAWSYDLLSPEEKALFRRLAVFAGRASFEAIEAVANSDGDLDVFGGIERLLEHSLIRQEEGPDGEPRFWMLETVREFGVEQLEVHGEETTTRDRHAGYFLALLERADPDVFGSGSLQPVLDAIEPEHDNAGAALRWSWETGDHDTLLRLAGALAWFWYYRGYLNEGQRWLSQALETPADPAAPRPRAWALTASGLIASVSGEPERAAELLTASFDWWERSSEAVGHAVARGLLGGLRVSQGQYDEAAALFLGNEAFFQGGAYEIWIAHARFHLGVIAWMQGDEDRARSVLRDAAEHFDRSEDPAHASDSLRYLGLIACAAGDLDEAARWFREMLTRLHQQRSRRALAVGLADVATLAAAHEAWHPAAQLFAKAEALLQDEGAAFTLPARDHYERAHVRARDALGEDVYHAAADAGRALTLEQALSEAEAVLELDHNGGADTALVL